MSQLSNPLEIYKLLQKTNCGQCRIPSCMAFAVAIVQGQKELNDCPYIDEATLELLGGKIVKQKPPEQDSEKALNHLRQEILRIDFAEAAARVGGTFENGRLVIRCLVKDFLIDNSGNITSECHINPWIQIPLLNYVIHCKGSSISRDWITFGELEGALDWKKFFAHRCEKSMKQLADAHDELFFDILRIFGGEPLTTETSADHSIIIHPLPKLPFLINYWGPEEGFDSKLNILFDRSAQDTINMESIYLLGRGLVEMFRQLIPKHSKDGKLF